MRRSCRDIIFGSSIAALLLVSATASWAQAQFPYEREMLLDVRPLAGSRRVPMLEFLSDGRVTVDLWCRSGTGQAEVREHSITLMPGTMNEGSCTPEQRERDEALAAA